MDVVKLFRQLLCGIFYVMMSQQASAEMRMALVIGNGGYQSIAPLQTPEADAKTVGETLSSLGFQVFLATELNYERMQNAFALFQEKTEFADTVLIFFAGHGMQKGGHNFILPTDYNPNGYGRPENAFNIAHLTERFSSHLRTNIFVIDACLDDPNARSGSNEARDLSLAPPSIGSLITYSATIGTKAYDGINNHSIFTGAFLDNIKTPEIDIEELFRNTRRDVLMNSNNHQMPMTISSLVANFQMNPKNDSGFQQNEPNFKNLSEQGFSNKSVLQDMEYGLQISQQDKAKQTLRKLLCSKLKSPLPPQCH